MDLNTILIFSSFAVILLFIIIMYLKAKNNSAKTEEKTINDFPKILEHIKQRMVEIDKDDYALTMSASEFERAYRRKARTREALANCVHGIESAKIVVIDLIRTIIAEDVEPSVITKLLSLDSGFLPPPNIQFEILLYRYKKKYGKQALSELIGDGYRRYKHRNLRRTSAASKN